MMANRHMLPFTVSDWSPCSRTGQDVGEYFSSAFMVVNGFRIILNLRMQSIINGMESVGMSIARCLRLWHRSKATTTAGTMMRSSRP